MKILLVSLQAGGGHRAALDSLKQSLQRFTPHVHVESFISATTRLDHAHRLAYTTSPRLYDLVYNATAQRALWHRLFFTMTWPLIRDVYNELIAHGALHSYDAVISTHFMQTYALLKAKKVLGLAGKIIAYVPDFDDSCLHFPRYQGLQVDAVIAQGPLLLSRLAQLYSFPQERMQRGGFLPRHAFTEAGALSVAQAREHVARLDVPLASQLRPDVFTIVLTGGTYWAMQLGGLLRALADCPAGVTMPAWTLPAMQILVVCGHNDKAYEAYQHLRYATGLRLIPLPFLPAESLAAVFRSADVTVLTSVAPATLYELLEAHTGSLLVYRVNPGPERFNLAFFLRHNLGQYVPHAPTLAQMLSIFERSPDSRAQSQQAFCQAAACERTAARLRAQQTAKFIVRIAALPTPRP